MGVTMAEGESADERVTRTLRYLDTRTPASLRKVIVKFLHNKISNLETQLRLFAKLFKNSFHLVIGGS